MKRLSKEEKREQAVIDLINKMFEIAGHNVTYDDIKGRQDNWYQQWEMTTAENKEWEKWGVDHLRKVLKIPKYKAEKEMMWANLQWGLKWDEYGNPSPIIDDEK